ncbi:hypothetical protein F3W84_07955 [Ochrobactrum quorumnocens]|uniref:Uncharacterized protein n=1 Tax=Ochrobactrum quorumnocens TaxID=271865 RepID=A0A5N1JZ61_9HYPH|nr:hypothetical protein F3W84_07955 [[Ochrobactrum] quorumnocens]
MDKMRGEEKSASQKVRSGFWTSCAVKKKAHPEKCRAVSARIRVKQ